ncbi:MAG TPA: PaaI family thioesterase [Herpetosiphon sp.]|uniref:Acyl-coenzyme A thioesterase THEM4 n=1 Tax=Herpetosiphon aurantiacus (strain ATCC 23779 / DSM 785 / 114-95) TaxID=316274 RepID=A9B3G8_HERA2|nr:PaaI family thioesterase [Herpetosiphon sp.]ABX04131.1 thioesterase superfamily protein [Herpetosiphon aurantiacus DSM 785]MCA0351205.1 PaaI family thioesterase [Chloroflexota bacterium]HBW48306.1 PaaI family thioesterase [Herpetosiphon sp.]
MNRQLDSQACFVCGKNNPSGLQLDFFEEEKTVITRFVSTALHQGWPGFVHGGIIATILDETLGRVGFLIDAWTMTGRFEVRYRQPAPIDQEITFTASMVRDRGRALEVEGFAQLPDGTIVAEATGLYMRVSPELRATLSEQIAEGY